MLRKTVLFVFTVLTVLILSISAVCAEIVPLPIDFSGGREIDQRYLLSDLEYKDPSLHIKIVHKRATPSCTYWDVDITIADVSQFRTASPSNFRNETDIPGKFIAESVNALLAINGDYFCYTGQGFILRQGKLITDNLPGTRDVLLVDENGDFHVVETPKYRSLSDTVDGKKVINAFFFGPILVKEGEAVKGVEGAINMTADHPCARLCIAQCGEKHYKVIVLDGSDTSESEGMTLQDFADFVATLGVETAYNLDGGYSTMLMFNGKKLNDPNNPKARTIPDIIYFVSAWQDE